MKKTLAFTLSLLIFASLGTAMVYAQGGNPPTGGENPISGGENPVSGGENPRTGGENPGNIGITLDNPFGETGGSLVGLLDKIFDSIIFPIGGILAVLAFIYSGFLFVSAQGNESKLTTAKTALLYTAVGTAVLLGARVISEVIGGTVDKLKI